MYGCDSWTIKKAEHQRIDAFELWRRFLRVPWTARRSNQSILKETSPDCSLEGLMLKLKLQYFGHLIWRTDSFEKTWERLKAGGEGDDRGWDGWMVSRNRWTWVWVGSGSWWWTERPGVLQSMGLQRVRHDWTTEWLTDKAKKKKRLKLAKSENKEGIYSPTQALDKLNNLSFFWSWQADSEIYVGIQRTQDSCNNFGLEGQVGSLVYYLISAGGAAAKLLQLCLNLCNPRDGSPPGSSVPWIL